MCLICSKCLRDNPTAWQTFSAKMADTRVRQNTCYFVPPRREICSSAGEGWKIHCHWARIATSTIPSHQFSNSSLQREHKNVEVNCKKILLAPWCRGFAAFTPNTLKNQEGIKIKIIIAETVVIGVLFQRCSALKLSNSLQLLLRKLMSSQMSRKNLKVDQIWWKLLWYFRFVLWSCNNHCHGVNFW